MSARKTLAVWKFASCDGCQLTLLDCEDELLPLAAELDIAYFLEAGLDRVEEQQESDVGVLAVVVLAVGDRARGCGGRQRDRERRQEDAEPGPHDSRLLAHFFAAYSSSG